LSSSLDIVHSRLRPPQRTVTPAQAKPALQFSNVEGD
jgi:hypothetical protein